MKSKMLHLCVAAALMVQVLMSCSSTGKTDEPVLAQIASQEARRHGWRRVEVTSIVFRDNFWYINIHKLPPKGTQNNMATVKVALDGTVSDFDVAPE
jgi:hypothetical protein